MGRDHDGTAEGGRCPQVRVWRGQGTGETPIRWEVVDRLREESVALLREVGVRAGEQSALYQSCAALWRRTEGEVLLSLLHSDFGNAVQRLEQARHALAEAPEAARRGELQPSDIEALLSGV